MSLPAPDGRPGSESRPVTIPFGVRLAAAWSWRLIVIVFALYLFLRLVAKVEELLVPLLVATLLVALVRPMYEQLHDVRIRGRQVPRGLAALITILITLLVVVSLITLIAQQVATGFPSLRDQASAGLDELQRWLAEGPFHISDAQISGWVDRAQDSLKANSDTVISGAVQVTSTAGHVIAGFFITMFATFFFLSGGRGIWAWLVGLFPRAARRPVDGAGDLAWSTLTAFVRATVLVALVDGTGVAVSAAILQVPLALPLGLLVFLGAFVPIVGAVVTGIVAVLVALVAQGPVVALVMLGAVIAVQQIEAHVLQPFLMGRAVAVHPLAVILAIGTGVIVAGIVGALFAVPFVAVVNVVTRYFAGGSGEHGAGWSSGGPGVSGEVDEVVAEAGSAPLADEPRPLRDDLAPEDEPVPEDERVPEDEPVPGDEPLEDEPDPGLSNPRR
jgi:predicted PurR-regulated permease PerM